MKNRSISNRRILARFLVPYIIILLMPILTGSFIYNETLQVVEKDAEKVNLGILKQVSQTVDQRINEMDGIMKQILNNSTFQHFAQIEKPHEPSQIYHLIETLKEMENYSLYNNFLINYYIAFNLSELVMGYDMTYTYLEFYKLVLKYEDKSFTQWQDEISTRYYKRHLMPAQPATMNKNPKAVSVITYMRSLNFSPKSNATIMILINENEFKNLMSRLDISDRGWAYITDENGRIISTINKNIEDMEIIDTGADSTNGLMQQEINGSKMLVSYFISSANGLKYVVVQPYEVVMVKVKYIRDMVFMITAITIIVGLLVASYLAYRNTKPVKEVIGNIAQLLSREEPPVRNEFDYINKALTGLISDNALLQEEIIEQKPYLTATFYSRLLKGDFKKEEDIMKLAKHIGLNIKGRYYAVGIIMLPRISEEISEDLLVELNKSSLFLKKLIQSTTEMEFHFFDVDEEKISVILPFDCDQDQAMTQFTELFTGIRDNLKKYGIYHGILAMGGIYESALNISLSFSDAMRVLNMNALENKTGIFMHQESELNSTGYYYPEEIEKRLMNLCRSGDKENVRKLLKEILNENLLNRKLPTEILTLFVYDIFGTLVKLVDQVSPGNEELAEKLQSLFRCRDTNELEMFRSGLDVFNQICDMVNVQKRSHNSNLKEQILGFVNTHYTDYNLCLSMVSEKYSLSEVYLSQFFKEQTGENFSSYLENIRIQKACELLKNTDQGINEISSQVGYSSSNTFCKVFKRVHGLNATNYRRNLPTDRI